MCGPEAADRRVTQLRGRPSPPRPGVGSTFAGIPERAAPRALVWAADAASTGTELGEGLAYDNRAVDLARQQGLLSLLPLALRRQAMELVWTSQFDQAYAVA